MFEKIAMQIMGANHVELPNVELRNYNLIERNTTNEEDIFFWVLSRISNKFEQQRENVKVNKKEILHRLSIFLSKERLKKELFDITTSLGTKKQSI